MLRSIYELSKMQRNFVTQRLQSSMRRLTSWLDEYKTLITMVGTATAVLVGAAWTLLIYLDDKASKKPKMLVTVGSVYASNISPNASRGNPLEDPSHCGSVYDTDSPHVQDGFLFERSAIDIAINNRSDKAVIVADLKIIPDFVTGSVFAGELDISSVYDIDVSTWHHTAICAGYLDFRDDPDLFVGCDKARIERMLKDGRIREANDEYWVKPDPVSVKEMPRNKFTVSAKSQERFQLRMFLSGPNDFLIGKLSLKAKLDSGEVLSSDLLDFSVCVPDPV